MLHTMIYADGQQRVMEEIPNYEIPVHDLQKSDDENLAKHIDLIRDQLSHKVYEPNQWPFFEIHISLLPHHKVLIHMSIDEWIVDAASVDLLLHQWYQLYHNPEYKLPVLEVSFRDVVMAWKDFENSTVFQRDLTYWMEKLNDIPEGPKLSIGTPELTDGKSYVPRSRYQGRLEKTIWNQLKQKANELNVSPTVLLLTLFSKVLAEYSHSKGFSLILTFFNRLPLHPQLDQVVGPFISTNIFVANQTSIDWEAQAKEYQTQVWQDLDHSSVSGIRAIRELRTRKLNSSIPPIPIVFTSMLNNVGKKGTETQTSI
ncbi:condensation domain-containing protein, partial [Bacillus mobilis]|uniref:condensation domain-containing protein n=1 Tax=Bacillus mobilis TaxID=2026190 RepID=UPI002E227465|nr:condensation domain-containing protein [Bacillus mobilis]